MSSEPNLPQQTRLSASGALAQLEQDTLTESGVVLFIGGAEQSHVELDDPSFLLHDYLRRMRSVITAVAPACFPSGAPASALHLGAGALTLPRWLQQRWAQLSQTVVDYEPELVDFVLEHLPMRSAPEQVVADAGSVLQPDGELAGRRFELIAVDLYNSAQAPPHLCTAEFFQQVLGALGAQEDDAAPVESGLMLLNFGDEADMGFARSLAATVLSVATSDDHALLSAPDAVIGGQEEGNLVMAVATGGFTQSQLGQIWAAGPHPATVLCGEDLVAWVQGRHQLDHDDAAEER